MEPAAATIALLEPAPESDHVLEDMPAPKIRTKRNRTLPKPILCEVPTSPMAAADELIERTRPRPKSPANPLATVAPVLAPQLVVTRKRWQPAMDFWIFVSMVTVLVAGMTLVAAMLGGL
jgi:hypothetical protein